MKKPIKIEKGIPIPAPRKGRGNTYPWREMKIGDSFYVDKAQSAFSNAYVSAGRRLGRKFSSRKEGKGCRVWRIK